MKSIVLFLSLVALPAVLAASDCCDCRCEHCGCQAHCQKVCHVVCEMKDVKVTCYCCKEEDICIPGHSKKCGEVCEPNPCCLAHPAECDACNGGCGDDSCGCDRCHNHSFLDCIFGNECCEKRTIWQPSCSSEIRSVNKLIKYEVTKKVPTYKWVVENCCDKCRMSIPPDQLKGPSSPPLPPTGRQASTAVPQMAPSRLTPPSDAVPVDSHPPVIIDNAMLSRLGR